MITNFSMLILNSECIISFRFENLFWCLDETLIKRHQAAAAASIPVTVAVRLFIMIKIHLHTLWWKIFYFRRLKGKGQFDENLRSYILPRG